MPFFKGKTATAPRREMFYFDDNASLNAMRYDDWKINFKWIEGNLFTGSIKTANVPIIVNLRQDPFERYPFESEFYRRWQGRNSGRSCPHRRSSRLFSSRSESSLRVKSRGHSLSSSSCNSSKRARPARASEIDDGLRGADPSFERRRAVAAPEYNLGERCLAHRFAIH